MSEKPPPFVDAEFEVIQPAERIEPPLKWSPWPWDYRWTIDWKRALILSIPAIAGLIAVLTRR